MIPVLEDPFDDPDHLAYHLNNWHAEGHTWTFVNRDNLKWWKDFHAQLPHPAGGTNHLHTHTGTSRWRDQAEHDKELLWDVSRDTRLGR